MKAEESMSRNFLHADSLAVLVRMQQADDVLGSSCYVCCAPRYTTCTRSMKRSEKAI